eukprot:1167117-Prymnesium_polylepis.1
MSAWQRIPAQVGSNTSSPMSRAARQSAIGDVGKFRSSCVRAAAEPDDLCREGRRTAHPDRHPLR